VHHMAVVGCGARMETPRNLWNCGANGEPALQPGYPSLTPCHSEDNTTTTLYLWSRGGEAVTLPPDTGFPVGGASTIQYLVLQVHYINVDYLSSEGDTAGVDLLFTDKEPSRSAGMLSVHVMTNVPALARSYQDGGCRVAERVVLNPFRYLVHTHAFGQLVSVWRVHSRRGKDEWKLIGKASPQAAQTFRKVSDPGLRLVEGDRVATRCVMLNMGAARVRQGLASYHEMCDVYIMYWVEGNHTKLLQRPAHCTSSGPPSTTWQSLGFRNIPETAASTL